MSARELLIAAALMLVPAGGAVAQITIGQPPGVGGPLTCGDFIHNPNGTWSPMHPVTVPGEAMPVTIGPATELRPGPLFPGAQLAARLSAICG